MDTKHIQSSRKRLYRRLVTAFGLWFGLLLFLMAATSLRRFTTPAVPPDDGTPAVTPNQAGAPPLAGVPSSTTQDHPADKAAKGAKQGTADADTARPVQPQKSSLRSDAAAAPVSTIRVAEAFGRLPLSFELNQGQTDRQVKFLAHGSGYTLFLTGHEAVLTLQATKKPERANARQGRLQMAARLAAAHREPAREARTMDVLRMKLVAANPAPKVEGAELLSGRSNYFVGKDS
ncbi:MAG TPA: hypothetical protein VJV74_14700, partial [Terriglobia bacterium]|nr:hypothetical protein [Terriglobia bacterium]